MAATALINRNKKSGRGISQSDLDNIRNVCRCNTYSRIREAVVDAAKHM
jgi:isoquinoline 1-oxidoreductase alpha subunit